MSETVTAGEPTTHAPADGQTTTGERADAGHADIVRESLDGAKTMG
ncbi:hypothetical protein ACFV06_28285 [Streptomyces sp. NPDC059618]